MYDSLKIFVGVIADRKRVTDYSGEKLIHINPQTDRRMAE